MQNKPILLEAGRWQLFLQTNPILLFCLYFCLFPFTSLLFYQTNPIVPRCNTFTFAEVLIGRYNYDHDFC